MSLSRRRGLYPHVIFTMCKYYFCLTVVKPVDSTLNVGSIKAFKAVRQHNKIAEAQAAWRGDSLDQEGNGDAADSYTVITEEAPCIKKHKKSKQIA